MQFKSDKEIRGALATIALSLAGIALLIWLPDIPDTKGRVWDAAIAILLIFSAPLPLLRLKLARPRFARFVRTEGILLALIAGMTLFVYSYRTAIISRPMALVAIALCAAGVVAVFLTVPEFGLLPQKNEMPFEPRISKQSAPPAVEAEVSTTQELYSQPWHEGPRWQFVFLLPAVVFFVIAGIQSVTIIAGLMCIVYSLGRWLAWRRRSRWIAIDADGISAERYDSVSQRARWNQIERIEERAPNMVWGWPEIWVHCKGSDRPIVATSTMRNSDRLFASLRARHLSIT